MFRKFFKRDTRAVNLNTAFARKRMAASMPGEQAALTSVRYGCMSF